MNSTTRTVTIDATIVETDGQITISIMNGLVSVTLTEEQVNKELSETLRTAIDNGRIAVGQPMEFDGRGYLVTDKERDPELYDWAVNG